ncbi:hypothetical protein DYB25_000555 [Aphanomyces astaci]|uniref:PCI domain-containing protein n=1 Tax=Aphanomyces astaci TaxID=112090 RepID=A0A397ENZ5_APHAT|nr:hypothetical protein DYB25_000555 [Aphanomyces astaci]RHY42434.1 hypothetical protein DYB34_005897 [Aphanomyces astaci]RHY64083.1 hypothetical protein DYB38_003361 [Aphanomyces astaci]RHY65395.1 hypothetical protein DYB30_003137 [Aphanomyces astaci]RHZ01558.1 hypothetical protein DYB31_001854 [Aphanomyces astaci]
MVASDDGSLEQFTLLAKTARGRACVALIQQVLSNKKLFVFGELLDMPNVKALAESDQTDQQGHARLLAIFAHGRYLDYVRQKEDATFHIPDLNAAQALKLRKLTVVSLCQQHKSVPYRILMGELQISSVRDVEDIVIDTIYSGLVEGKLDQKNEVFESSYSVGRDVQPSDIDDMILRLTQWFNPSIFHQAYVDTTGKTTRNKPASTSTKCSGAHISLCTFIYLTTTSRSHATAVEAEKAERDLSVKNTVAAVRLQAKDRHLPGSDVDPELIYGDGHGGSYHRPISGPGYSRMIATFSMSLSMIGV